MTTTTYQDNEGAVEIYRPMQELQIALIAATDNGMLDRLACYVSPSIINAFCDAVMQYKEEEIAVSNRLDPIAVLTEARMQCAERCYPIELRIANAVAWHLLDDAIAYLQGCKVKGVRYLPSEIVAEA